MWTYLGATSGCASPLFTQHCNSVAGRNEPESLSGTKGKHMATSPVNAANLTQEQLSRFLIQTIEYKLQIAQIWPFMGVLGGKLRYERTNTLESVANINDMATILGDGTAITEKTAGADTSKTFTCGELATRYLIDYNAQDRYRFQSLDAVEAVLACARLKYMYFRKLDLDNGGGSGDFDSLYNMVDATLKFDMAGVAPTLPVLQQTYHAASANAGMLNCIMCNARASRAIIKAYNDVDIHPQQIEMDWFDPLANRTVKRKVNSINGAPILINDMVATDGTNKTRIYFMLVGESCDRGVHGVTGIVPLDLKDKMFVRRESSEPSGATTSRINVAYSMPVATAMGTAGALSILENVLVAA